MSLKNKITIHQTTPVNVPQNETARCIIDENGMIIHTNRAFCEKLGIESDTLHQANDIFTFSAEEQSIKTLSPGEHQIYLNEKAIIESFHFDWITNTSGKRYLIAAGEKDALNNTIPDDQNTPIPDTTHDMLLTALKEKEEHLKRRERQLSEAEAIGRMGHWHWIIGEEDISWSEEIFRVFGLDKSAFKPSINALTPLIHKRDLGRVVQVFQRAMIEEKSYDMDFRIIHPGGDIRFVSCEGRCEKDENGEVIALYGIIQDMTERMLYEQNLKRAKDTSEQAYAAKSRFLANMSHELRTPLNAIIGFSEMIESQMLGPLFNDKYIEYATSIKESGHHLLDLISDILDMSKIEAGKHTLDLEEVNIKTILERAMHMIQGRAQEQNITLRNNDLENSDLTITGDRRALTQIFLNLLSNAVKFTPAHGSIWIECLPAQDYIAIKVCDTGVGIPPNKRAAVLKPFEQASGEYTRDHEGTGLGLSITKELIELHGGSMSLDSEVNIGTTVTVRLPYTTKSNQK